MLKKIIEKIKELQERESLGDKFAHIKIKNILVKNQDEIVTALKRLEILEKEHEHKSCVLSEFFPQRNNRT